MSRRGLVQRAKDLLWTSGATETVRGFYRALKPPAYPGVRLTPKRLLNLYLARYQRARGHDRLIAYPPLLTVEATNVCNLRCPFCFTGAGEVGRERSMMQIPLFQKVLDELGDYLFYIELCNWGEPLLNKHIYEMIRMADDRGISTVISTNFSVPFDEEKAEALVSSGLPIFGVSLDGARQETYEQYRVGGDLDKILHNVRLVNEAKKKLGSKTPRVIWEFHVFEWNKDDIELATSMAEELGMEIAVSKGWVADEEWERRGQFNFGSDFFFPGLAPERCKYLWMQAVVNNDGAVAPCCGVFYREDDFGSLADHTFKDVWNNEKFRAARRMYRSGGSDEDGSLVCSGCPVTLTWSDYQKHRAAGGDLFFFEPRFTMNDGFNYFFNRKPGQPDAAGTVNLQPVNAPVSKRGG